jgi:quercetin dioxygenase-like cupin family protein
MEMLKRLALTSVALAAMLSSSTPFAAEGYVPTRTILQQTDVPGSNYTVIMAVTDIAANMTAARHMHPGAEVAYVLAGEAEFTIEGQGLKRVRAGESFRLDPGVKHSVKNGPAPTKILAIYTIPKGATLATPAPE